MASAGSNPVAAQDSGLSPSPAPGQMAVLAQFVAKPGQEGALREALLAMAARGREESGNIKVDVLVSKDNPAQFFVWENWTTAEDQAAHARGAEFNQLSHRVSAMLLAPMSETKARMLSEWDRRPGKKHPQGSPDQLTLVPFFTIKPDKIEATRQAHLAMVPLTRAEAGNIDYDLFQVIGAPNVMFFFENWDNKPALDEHMGKPYFTKYVRGQADANVAMPWTYLTLQMISPPGLGQAAR